MKIASLPHLARVSFQNLAVTLISFLIGLCICELIVRAFIPVRSVGPSFSTFDPFYGKALKKNFSVRRITPEFTMTFTTNSDGLRGPELKDRPSNSIVFLGDSMTMGYGVNDGEEYPARVRDILIDRGLTANTVINMGMGDNGNGRWIKHLRSQVEEFDPSIVVIQYLGNDFSDNVRERLFDLDSAGQLVELPIRPSVKVRVQSILDHIPGLGHTHLFGLTRQLRFKNNSHYQAGDSERASANLDQSSFEDRLFFALMDQVLTICKDQEWPVLSILVDIPEQRLKKMRYLLSESGAQTVVIPAKRERPDLYYKVDGHWNPSGHRYVAENVCEALEKTDGLFK